jgi:hypothetical protein
MSNLKRFEYTLSLTVGAIIDMTKGSNANDIPKVNIDLHDLITENIGEGVSTLNKSLGKLGFTVSQPLVKFKLDGMPVGESALLPKGIAILDTDLVPESAVLPLELPLSEAIEFVKTRHQYKIDIGSSIDSITPSDTDMIVQIVEA